MAVIGYACGLFVVCFVGLVAILCGVGVGRLAKSGECGAIAAFLSAFALNASMFYALYRTTDGFPPEVREPSFKQCLYGGGVLTALCASGAALAAWALVRSMIAHRE